MSSQNEEAQPSVTTEPPTQPTDSLGAENSSAAPLPAVDDVTARPGGSETVPPISEPLLSEPAATVPMDGMSTLADAGVVSPPDLVVAPVGDGGWMDMAAALSEPAMTFLRDGGYTIWAIAALSVITAALILWKVWRLALIGAWSRGKARRAVDLFESGQLEDAMAIVAGRRGLRSKVVHAALGAQGRYAEEAAREETTRVAKLEIGHASRGLRPLELIATIAPLLGLLGTVLGMIAAFQALQAAGAKADPATLAGGIWEALLTTAAGMAVAIPASAALTWFESILDRMAADVEDSVTRIFVAGRSALDPVAIAAE